MDSDPNILQDHHDNLDSLASNGHTDGGDARSPYHSKSSNPHERWSKLSKPRGRQPRDPQGQIVRFQCRDADDMENSLRGYLTAPTAPAEHTTIEFMFPVSSAFMVYAADFKNAAKQHTENEKQYGKFDRTALSVIDALTPSQDAKDRMRRQKAIAKVCVEACEQADGFRYSFHNNWLSREDEACRFSYFCNDSTLNKGRAANEGAGMAGKKMRKPVFNCQGLIAIKFSATKQNLEVHYKHVPLHKTYAERAPPPRTEARKKLPTDTTDLENSMVNSRKRKMIAPETSIRPKPHRRRATESAANSTSIGAIDLTREDSLQPLVEFLGSANTVDHNGESSLSGNSSVAHPQTSPVPTATRTSTGTSQVDGRHAVPKKPTIPGAMVGSVRKGYLNWTAKATTDANSEPSHDPQHPSNKISNPLPGINEAASTGMSDTTSIALSEILALKKKLEEAEERIKRLESEKANPAPPSHMPQHHALWPPPPGYAHPQQSPYSYPPQAQPYPPSPTRQGLMRFHPPPPQHPFPPEPEAPPSSDPSPAPDASAEPVQPPAQRSAQRSTKSSAKKPNQKSSFIGSKFVLYTPKAKKTPERNRQSSTATSTRASSAVNGE